MNKIQRIKKTAIKKEKGIAILFSPYMSSYGSNVISNISDVPYTKEVKKLIKTRKI